jgi:hypothetical protein
MELREYAQHYARASALALISDELRRDHDLGLSLLERRFFLANLADYVNNPQDWGEYTNYSERVRRACNIMAHRIPEIQQQVRFNDWNSEQQRRHHRD